MARSFATGKRELPPLRCGYCRSSSVTRAGDELTCLSCSRITDLHMAHVLRRQEIAMMIRMASRQI